MTLLQLVYLLLFIVLLIGLSGLVYYLSGGFKAQQSGGMRSMMSSPGKELSNRPDPYQVDTEMLRKQSSKRSKKSRVQATDLNSKLFKAGFFTSQDKERFKLIRVVCFVAFITIIPTVAFSVLGNPTVASLSILLGAMIGYLAPLTWLDKQIKIREDEVLYYLPLVIEQVSIGVSSALDIGPCLSMIVEMANERDAHNPVTEMFMHVEKLMRSGLNLEDSLVEVAEANGGKEIKHAFMFLAQCARHGGEVSKQLQELADAVMTQRQVQVDAKITALPVKATGALAMVFAGFFCLLFAGLTVKLMGAFGGS